MMNDMLWLPHVLLALHILAACAWLGGMLYALVVLRPAVAVLEATQRTQVMLIALKRFFLVVWHAMPIMLLTGWGMIPAAGWSMALLPWYVNAMQGLAMVMAGVFLYTFFVPYLRLRRAIRPTPDMFNKIRSLMLVNLGLGTAIVVIASLGHSW